MDTATKWYITFLCALIIVFVIATMGYRHEVKQYNSEIEAAITEEIEKREEEKEVMVDFLKESRDDQEYRYIIDGVELQDIDKNTIENCDRYHIVIDEETKTIMMTTRGFGQ